MKSCYVFVIAALAAIYTSSKLRKLHKKHRSHRIKGIAEPGDEKLNLFYIFFKFAFLSINEYAGYVNNTAEAGRQCYPSKERSKEATETGDIAESPSVTANLSDQVSTWTSIKSKLEEGINFVCHFKSYVIAFKNYLVDNLKQEEAKLVQAAKTKKLFFHKKNHKTHRGVILNVIGFVDYVEQKVNLITDTAAKITDEIKKGVQIAKNKVVNTVNDAINYIKNALSGLFTPIINAFQAIQDKIQAFWGSPFITKVRKFLEDCGNLYKELGTLIGNFLKTIVGLVLLEPSTWFTVLLRMICNWEKLSKAVDFIQFFKNPSPVEKWAGIGKFVGTLIYIIGYDA